MQSEPQQTLGGETEASASTYAESNQPTASQTTTTYVFPPSNHLAIFFSKFKDFDYDPTRSLVDAESEFDRLAALRKWRNSGKRYNKNRREFRVALEKTTALRSASNQTSNPSVQDPIRAFFAQFPSFKYNGADEGIHPRSEFDRLGNLQGWTVGSKRYRLNEKQFRHAVQFGLRDGYDPMSFYFAAWPAFAYNTPVINASTAALEFERLCRIHRWTGRKESRRRTDFNNALSFVYGDDTLEEEVGSTVIAAEIAAIQEGLGGVRIHEEPIPSSESSAGPVTFTPSTGSGPLDDFFALYRDFNYNHSAPSGSEFQRLCTLRKLGRNSRRFKKLRAAFTRATGEELLWQLGRDVAVPATGAIGREQPGPNDSVLGRAEENSKHWIRMCEILDLKTPDESRPRNITQCKKVLKTTFINIYDFVDHLRYGKELRRFPTLKALASYSYDEDAVFSRHVAKKSGLLKFLLQRISSAHSERKD